MEAPPAALVRRVLCGARFSFLIRFGFSEEDRGVRPAESEGVREGTADVRLTGLVGNVVQIAFWIGSFIIDGWQHDSVLHRQHRKNRLDSSGPSQEMARHRLRRTDGNLVGLLAEGALDRNGFQLVVERSGGAVGVDIIDLLDGDTGILDRHFHGPYGTFAIRVGRGDVVGVGTEAIA